MAKPLPHPLEKRQWLSQQSETLGEWTGLLYGIPQTVFATIFMAIPKPDFFHSVVDYDTINQQVEKQLAGIRRKPRVAQNGASQEKGLAKEQAA